MTEKMELTTERMGKIKEAAMHFKDTVMTYFKDHEVELKDWKFAVENSETNYIIDASVKILVKQKRKG
jgi:hypothetical protein